MRKASPRVQNLARRLLGTPVPGEAATGGSSIDALMRSCEALRPRLIQVFGREGFRALMLRAVTLAKGEHPFLDGVQVSPEGSLTGLNDALSERAPADDEAGCVTVLAHFLGLLEAFVGAEITRQLVNGAWSDSAVYETEFGTEEV